MSLFANIRPTEFNRNDVVVCHELGHTVVWYSFGRETRGIIFRRSRDGYLSGGAANVNPPNLESRRDAEQFAERMMAGDSASRRKLNLRRDQISTVGVPVTTKTNIPALLRTANLQDDAMWAIWAAYKTMKPGRCESILVRLGKTPRWYKWLSVHLGKANSIIDANWCAIEAIAQELTPQLPAVEGQLEIPASKLIPLLEQKGVQQCN